MQAVAQAAGLQAEIDPTTTVHDHVLQHNQSDLSFIQSAPGVLAMPVDEGKLIFRKPSTQAPAVTLTWGADLLSFTPRMTLAEQVDEVVVRACRSRISLLSSGAPKRAPSTPISTNLARTVQRGRSHSAPLSASISTRAP